MQNVWYLIVAIAGSALVLRWIVIWTRNQMIGPFWLVEWTEERRRILFRSCVEMLVAFLVLVAALKAIG